MVAFITKHYSLIAVAAQPGRFSAERLQIGSRPRMVHEYANITRLPIRLFVILFEDGYCSAAVRNRRLIPSKKPAGSRFS